MTARTTGSKNSGRVSGLPLGITTFALVRMFIKSGDDDAQMPKAWIFLVCCDMGLASTVFLRYLEGLASRVGASQDAA